MLFCFENGSKGGQNLEHFTYLEGVLNNSIERVKQDKCSRYSRSTKLLFPVYYGVQHCTASKSEFFFSTKLATLLYGTCNVYTGHICICH